MFQLCGWVTFEVFLIDSWFKINDFTKYFLPRKELQASTTFFFSWRDRLLKDLDQSLPQSLFPS